MKNQVEKPELCFLLGLALFASGLWWIYPPLCLMLLGVFCMAVSIAGAIKWDS